MKNAKIVEIIKLGEHPYDGKTMYDTTMKLDNGDEGTCTKGKANFFTVGQVINYEIKDNGNYGMKITLQQEENKPKNKGGTRQKEDPVEKFIGFSASYAKDLIECGKVELKDFEGTADMFLNWMTKKHSQNKPVQAPQTQQTTPSAQSTNSELITEEQRKYANALWTKTGNNRETWKKYILETYKKDSSTKLTKKEATEFIEYIKTLEPMPLPTKPIDEELPF